MRTFFAIATLLISLSTFAAEGSIDFSKAKRGSVLIFLSAKCPCSLSHEDELKKLATEYEPKGFKFYGVSANKEETAEEVKSHFEKSNLGFEIIKDSDQKLANQYGALKTPHAFVLSPKGAVIYQGGVSDSAEFSQARTFYLRRALEQIFQGKEISPNKTLSVGCNIQR